MYLLASMESTSLKSGCEGSITDMDDHLTWCRSTNALISVQCLKEAAALEVNFFLYVCVSPYSSDHWLVATNHTWVSVHFFFMHNRKSVFEGAIKGECIWQISLFLSSSAAAPTVCPKGYVYWTHPTNKAVYCYQAFGSSSSNRQTWYGARTACRSTGKGYDLVSIHDHYELAQVKTLLTFSTSRYWIGINDLLHEGGYVWVCKLCGIGTCPKLCHVARCRVRDVIIHFFSVFIILLFS